MSDEHFDESLKGSNPYPVESPLPRNTEALKSQIFQEITMKSEPKATKSRLTKAALGTAAALIGAVTLVGLPSSTPAAVADIQEGAEARNSVESGKVDFACSVQGLNASAELSDYAVNFSKSVDGEDFSESWAAVPFEGTVFTEAIEVEDLSELAEELDLSEAEIAELESSEGFVVEGPIEVFELDEDLLSDEELDALFGEVEGNFIDTEDLSEEEIAELEAEFEESFAAFEAEFDEELEALDAEIEKLEEVKELTDEEIAELGAEIEELELTIVEELKFIDGIIYEYDIIDGGSDWKISDAELEAIESQWESIAIPEGAGLIDAEELAALLDEDGEFEVVELEDGGVVYSGPADFVPFGCANDVLDGELFNLIADDLEVIANAELDGDVLKDFELSIDGSELDFDLLAEELGLTKEEIEFEKAVMEWSFEDIPGELTKPIE